MWVLELLFNYFFFIFLESSSFLEYQICNLYFFNYVMNFGIFFLNVPQNSTFLFSVKLLLSVMLLILVRGGTPRYRYDYLTKLGWLKFLGLTASFFLIFLLLYFLL